MTITADSAVSGRLANLLRQSSVAHDVVFLDERQTAQQAAAAHVAGRYLAKVVVAKGATGEPFLLVLPAPQRLDAGAVERAVGCEALRLLDDAEIGRLFPDCEKGEIPPLGGLYGLPTYVDACLARQPWIYFSSGSHRQTFGMRWEDYQRVAGPVVGGFCFHDSGE
jgi:Ala-tRNA(Pro) deacylase